MTEGQTKQNTKICPLDLEGNKNVQKIVNDTCIHPNTLIISRMDMLILTTDFLIGAYGRHSDL